MVRISASGLLMLLALTTGTSTEAQLETLVMPGEVVEGHADLEAECSNCHKAFNRSLQRDLCLGCHEDVAVDIETSGGFHGRDPEARGAACASCHTDHEGRDADIVGLVEAAFDHDLTDFELLGSHAGLECRDCHVKGTRHRDAPLDCIGCHEADNPHAESLGAACGDCHTASEWSDAVFDHDATGYPLIGRHTEPACLDCHEDRTFLGAADTCYGCHADDDTHNGRSGNVCENCHSPRGWSDTSFDHDRDTDFRLAGGHAGIDCSGCHSDEPFADRLSLDCVSCHAEDDEHDGYNGENCEACHDTTDWTEVYFDHDVDTHYPLSGAHREAECKACHIEPVFEVALGQDCLSCHEDDDAHEGSQGPACEECHSERSWEEDVFFDHGLTAFPLLGRHADADCGDCHETHVFTDAPTDCIGCHRDEDTHEGRFGDECSLCHNPVGWMQWLFDHDLQTDYPLEGAHREVDCEGCHRGSLDAQRGPGRNCVDCHRGEDVHDGEFGPDCGRCHSPSSFTEVRSIR